MFLLTTRLLCFPIIHRQVVRLLQHHFHTVPLQAIPRIDTVILFRQGRAVTDDKAKVLGLRSVGFEIRHKVALRLGQPRKVKNCRSMRGGNVVGREDVIERKHPGPECWVDLAIIGDSMCSAAGWNEASHTSLRRLTRNQLPSSSIRGLCAVHPHHRTPFPSIPPTTRIFVQSYYRHQFD